MDAYDRAILRGRVCDLEAERKRLRARLAESERESDARLRALILAGIDAEYLHNRPLGKPAQDTVQWWVCKWLRQAGAAVPEK